ncbi:hypothetical protein HDV03_001284 [Kappamyces sp. JEL0829]|nr:hypothetical protein HDV03_001284 [Kappamyces sp. JEL0829]
MSFFASRAARSTRIFPKNIVSYSTNTQSRSSNRLLALLVATGVATGLTAHTLMADEGQKRIASSVFGSSAAQHHELIRRVGVPDKKTTEKAAPPKELKKYKRGQVAAHNTSATGIWVTYENGVYDVTDFVKIHPGGEKIMLAAGKAIDPFWAIFSIHSSPETRELLETYRIGDLVPLDQDETAKDQKSTGLELLFANEPTRDPSLIVHSARPCNAEAAMESLETYITPNDKFYVRNHLPVPKIDIETFRLELEGPGIPDGTALSIAELKNNFPKTSVTVTLQCAGNRRKEMHDVKPVKGLQWNGGAISNATWTGVRLSDVLRAAGYQLPDLSSAEPFPYEIEHIHLNGAEGYGASIPLEKGIDPRGDVILAYEMNGEPIPADHGYPLRAVIPGNVAARSVKWLSKVSLDSSESPSHWQQRDYKGFSPSADITTSDYSTAQSIQELPVQSSFIMKDNTLLAEDGYVTIKGYAIAGGGRGINRVDVSSDGGKTWKDAELVLPPQPRGRNWAWTHWQVKFPVSEGQSEMKLVCKAVDSAYNTQPDDFKGIYNAQPLQLAKEPLTELARELAQSVKITGPLSMNHYMRSCLTHPTHGYYMHRDVFGTQGDFITSPEISQMFGELVGVWFLHSLLEHSPDKIQIVELGPGRGTLMADLLRTFRQFPAFFQKIHRVSLVEASPFLRSCQKKALGEYQSDGLAVDWFDRLQDVPNDHFTIYFAHEFFDALPVYQFQKLDSGWRELMVDIDTSPETTTHFRHALAPDGTKALVLLEHQSQYKDVAVNDIVQISPDTWDITCAISTRIKDRDGLALFADYGARDVRTNKLRGIKGHQWISPFSMPGKVDLSTDVEFAAIQKAAETSGTGIFMFMY